MSSSLISEYNSLFFDWPADRHLDWFLFSSTYMKLLWTVLYVSSYGHTFSLLLVQYVGVKSRIASRINSILIKDLGFYVQFSSVAQLCPTLCDPMDCSTPGLPVHHQLPEYAQIHVHWISNAIQPSHPVLSPSPSAFNLSQHQGLFKWVSSSHQVAKVLEFQLQHQSLEKTLRTDHTQDGLVGTPCCPRDSQESSPTPQSQSINFLALSFLCSPTVTSIHNY